MPFFCFAPGLRTRSRDLYPARIRITMARFALIVCVLAATSDYASSNPGFQPFKDDPNEPWHISADEISYDKDLDQYTAKGNVSVTKTDKNLTADFVRLDQQTNTVLAIGHVVMTAGEDVLIGNRLEMDLETETGTVYNGTIFMQAKHFYIKGDKIQKAGPDSYSADKGCVTTCDGDHPAWKITGKDIHVTIEGYGIAKHSILWAKDVPVIYLPWLVFPVKIKRQSGLLPPQIGYSTRKWEEYIQPFYLVTDDSSDATFYAHHMGRRGEKLGLEYRYVVEQSKGTLMYDYLDDKKVDSGNQELNKDWGYFDDGSARPNSDRYWFRMKHDQALPHEISAKLDVDFMSDQDYLREFEAGYTGFEQTNEYFIQTFGRELDEKNEFTRTNKLTLTRSWSQHNFNGELRWYDNVINRRQSDTDTTLQKLPYIEFNASKQPILTSPFYYDLDSEYTYFYREDGQRGHRVDAYPRFYLPYKFKHYFTIEPSMGLRETFYHFDKDEYTGSTKEQNLSREMYDIKVDLSSEIYRTYSGIGENIDKIKHTVRPQLIYTYTPNKEQNKFPSFDALDLIGKQRLLTYSITNTLTSKSLGAKKESGMPAEDKNSRQRAVPRQGTGTLAAGGKSRQPAVSKQAAGTLAEDENDQPLDYKYNEFCRFKLEQSYDINEAQEDKTKKQPFLPIYGEIDLLPTNYFNMHADATRSPYNNFFQTYNVAATIWDKRNNRLFIERRYNHSSSDSIMYGLDVVISEKLTAYTDYERNLLDGIDIKTSLGFLYKSQCWSLEARYSHEGHDRSYMFVVGLYGIAEFHHGILGRRFEKPQSSNK